MLLIFSLARNMIRLPQGILVTLAIGLHNVPEGLATATVLVARGIPASHAFWWTLATSLPQPLLALPSFVFVDAFSSLLPLALGFAAGCMVWMVFAELLPDALADAPHTEVHLICATSMLLLVFLWNFLSGSSAASRDTIDGHAYVISCCLCR